MTESHPARNAEFLSRLHDGELSPAERAHFESHRAHCAECRRAASEFESALSLYRSSRPAPASPDLAGRILRKLQTSSPPRRRFGPSFGIDLRWAGAFAAAVVAAIVGSAIVGRNEARESLARTSAPIPIVVQSRPVAAGGSVPASPSAPAAASESARQSAEKQEEQARLSSAQRMFARKRDSGAANEQALAKPADGRALAGKLSDSEKDGKENRIVLREETKASARTAKTESPAVFAQRPEPQASAGGVAGAPQAAPPAAARAQAANAPGSAEVDRMKEKAPSRARVRIEALDGMSAPEFAETPALPAALSGRAWVVVVAPGGRVRSASEETPRGRRDAAAADETRAASPPAEILQLRFTAGDRERRVLVRVE